MIGRFLQPCHDPAVVIVLVTCSSAGFLRALLLFRGLLLPRGRALLLLCGPLPLLHSTLLPQGRVSGGGAVLPAQQEKNPGQQQYHHGSARRECPAVARAGRRDNECRNAEHDQHYRRPHQPRPLGAAGIYLRRGRQAGGRSAREVRC
jgi:hypothetical protein